MPVPAELESPTEDVEVIHERDRTMIWKVKGATARLFYRLFRKYCNTKVSFDGAATAYKQHFYENYAETLCETHLQILFKRKTNFVGSPTLSYSLRLLQ